MLCFKRKRKTTIERTVKFMFTRVCVGELLKENVTSYQEGVRFDVTESGMEMLVYINRPSLNEIEEIKKKDLKLALTSSKGIIFIMSKFGTLQWFDAPYSVHLSKPFELDKLEEGIGYALNITLVDAATGIVKAMRLVGMPTRFSRKLAREIDEQRYLDFDKEEYIRNIQSIYSNYSTKDLLKRAFVECRV